ncbi:MAG: PEP-CTERM sorting domain-containing protein [Sedimentisphaerales bacterium]|nr:PEP-CTERM sorting domain-containing protein [Sedimentisphaerales bacterium]
MMRILSMKNAFMAVVLAVCTAGVCSAQVLLYDTFADGSRVETNLPTESAVWVGTPGSVTMGTGSLAYAQSTGSQKLWTYFAANGSPVSLEVGQQLIATIGFTPRQTLYDVTSKNFRFGLFNDLTNDQLLSDTNSDSGGTGNPWEDSTGYAVHFPLSSGPSGSNASVGKRIPNLTTSLLGSGSAYPGITSGGDKFTVTLDTLYTLTLVLDYQAANQMEVTFSIADATGVISTNSILDDGTFGGYDTGVYTNFDQLFFRFSKAEGTADVIDFNSIKVELIPEPATLALLGLGALVSLRKRR